MLSCNISPNEAEKSGVNINKDGVKRNALELLAMNNVGFGGMVKIWPEFKDVRTDVIQQLSIEAIYSVYLEKQNADLRQRLNETYDFIHNQGNTETTGNREK